MATVLLIEDAPDTKDLVQMLLEMANHRVLSAETGEEGLKLAKQFSPDVILMDMNLPGELDGLEAVRRLREDADFDRTPILVLTAHALGEDRRRSFDAGCDEHITKPIFDLSGFTEIVNRFAAEGRRAIIK